MMSLTGLKRSIPLKFRLGLALPVRALALAWILSPIHAAEEPSTWEIRVAAVDILPGHDTLWLRSGHGIAPVKVPLNIRTFSQPIRYKGPAKANFFRDGNEASLEKPPAALAAAVLGEKASLIVFHPNADGSGYQPLVIADSAFPFGRANFFL